MTKPPYSSTAWHVCSKCHVEKIATDFHMKRGKVTAACKACHSEANKRLRAQNLERYRAAERERSYTPRARALARVWHAKHAAERIADSQERFRANKARYQAQVDARRAVRNAMARGDLKRPALCERCGEVPPKDAHHDDYAKPLEVMWLCRACHGVRHRELNALKRAAA